MLFCRVQCMLRSSCCLVAYLYLYLLYMDPQDPSLPFWFYYNFAELSSTKSRIELPVLEENIWCPGLHFECEPVYHAVEWEIKSSISKLGEWLRSVREQGCVTNLVPNERLEKNQVRLSSTWAEDQDWEEGLWLQRGGYGGRLDK